MEIGQKLPEVLGIDQDGKEWTLAELSGKKIVLYIYPHDSTPGCTNEACNLRDNYERFLSLGYVVIGVSTQDAKSHKKFIEKNNLPFPSFATQRRSWSTNWAYSGRRKCAAGFPWTYSAPPSSLMKLEPSLASSGLRKSR